MTKGVLYALALTMLTSW